MVQFSALCHPVTTSICPQLHHMGCFEIFMIWLVLSSSFGCLVPTLSIASGCTLIFILKKPITAWDFSPSRSASISLVVSPSKSDGDDNGWECELQKKIYIYRKYRHLCFQCWRASNLFFTRTLWFLFCKNPIISGGWRLTKPNSNQVPRKKESRKVVQNRSLPHALVNSM